MQTTTIGAMRLVAVVMVMALGACGGDPLHTEDDTGAVDAGGAGGAPGQVQADAGAADTRPTAAELVGRWCSPSFGELDLQADGAYVSILSGQRSEGTWVVTDGMYLTFLGPHGEAGAVQTIVAVTPASLTLTGFSGQLTFARCE
jgi:hypothetical protein